MSTAIDRFDEQARRLFARLGRTAIYRGELLRHPVYTRFLHWSVAIFFILSLLSGLAVYSPWLFHFLTPLFGGGPMARALHPWFGVLFEVFFLFQFLNWIVPMAWTSGDSRFLRNIRQYLRNEDDIAPEETGFFNGGQKIYFWSIVLCGVLFLVTGLLLWFDDRVSRLLVAVSYVVHDVAALIMLGGLIIHIYESTAALPGTFRSMINGTVAEKWAWTHHPAWYRAVTGRDPREAYERARERQAERRHAIEAREREEDARDETGLPHTPPVREQNRT